MDAVKADGSVGESEASNGNVEADESKGGRKVKVEIVEGEGAGRGESAEGTDAKASASRALMVPTLRYNIQVGVRTRRVCWA